MKEYYKEYVENNGKYPDNESKKWETKEQLSNRVMSVIDKYKDKYDSRRIYEYPLKFSLKRY